MAGLARTALSPWGAHVIVRQTGAVHWAYYTVSVPAGHLGFQLTAETVQGAGGLELFIQGGTVNPAEAAYRKRSEPGSKTLDLSAGELLAGEFTYRIEAPTGFEGELAIPGLISIDGESFPVTGDSRVRFGTLELPPPVTPEVSGDRLALEVTGPLNARVIIETSNALGGVWSVAAEFQIGRSDEAWSVPIELEPSGRFFRVRIEAP